MAVNVMAHPSVADRRAQGADARIQTPAELHADWTPPADRFDPVELLCDQDKTREPDLVPVRHGRMMVSPFTFYRGAARIMAADLATMPNAGLISQLCGDAHLSNFGGFASPERRLMFDLNDFDETLPGPFEYDVKRMAASFTIAARNNGFTTEQGRAATLAAVQSYREAMAEFATMGVMDLWYAHISEEDLTAGLNRLAAEANTAKAARLSAGSKAAAKVAAKAKGKSKDAKAKAKGKGKPKDGDSPVVDDGADLRALKNAEKALRKAHTRDSLQALSKLGELYEGRYRIVSQPPVVVPIRDWAALYDVPDEAIEPAIHQ